MIQSYMPTIGSALLILIFSSFPLFLWGYGTRYLSHHLWNRGRFFAGMIGGGLSVIAILIGEIFTSRYTLWSMLFVFLSVMTITVGLALALMRGGSPYIRTFLRKSALLHIWLIVGFFVVILLVTDFTQSPVLTLSLSALFGVLFSASLEEWVKHISTLGLTAREFRFSRRDFLIFTFFITLGFVTIENLIYLIKAFPQWTNIVFFTGFSRICFALPIHVLSASICVIIWWRALSYRVFSLQYCLTFLYGFAGAVAVHALYNNFISGQQIFFVILLALFGYYFFTQSLLRE